jgi:hypothetical protein
VQFGAQSLDQEDEILGDVMGNDLHPQGDREMAALVQVLSALQSACYKPFSHNFNGSRPPGWVGSTVP